PPKTRKVTKSRATISQPRPNQPGQRGPSRQRRLAWLPPGPLLPKWHRAWVNTIRRLSQVTGTNGAVRRSATIRQSPKALSRIGRRAISIARRARGSRPRRRTSNGLARWAARPTATQSWLQARYFSERTTATDI